MKHFAIMAFLLAMTSHSFAALYIGETKAILESISNKRAEINFAYDSSPAPKFAMWPSDSKFEVYYRMWDDSKLAGYSLNVWQTLDMYNFNTWAWTIGGTGNSATGTDTMRGKYDNSGIWNIYPLNQGNVTKFKLTLSADTKSIPRRTESREFYVLKNMPDGSRTAKKQAAMKWIVGRLERATMFRNMADTWKAKRTSTSSVNYNLEMGKIIMSAAGLFGPTDAKGYAIDSGIEFLDLASSVFGNVATSSLVSVGGAVYQAYDWGTWAKSTLQSSANLWNSAFSDFRASQTANLVGTGLENDLYNLANAMRDDANEVIRIMYTAPYDSTANWKSLLSLEKSRANSVGVSAASAKSKADQICGTGSNLSNFFETINKLANAEWMVLNQISF